MANYKKRDSQAELDWLDDQATTEEELWDDTEPIEHDKATGYRYPSEDSAWVGDYETSMLTADLWQVCVVGGPVYTHIRRSVAIRKAQAYVTASRNDRDTTHLLPDWKPEIVTHGDPPF